MSSQPSHHPHEVLLAQFSPYVHKNGLKPDSFHFYLSVAQIDPFHKMHFDELLTQHLGEMGTFQKIILLIHSIQEFFAATSVMAPVFTAAIPKYR